jgi:6-phosphogluconate dehydrogenase (decarboxylating)
MVPAAIMDKTIALLEPGEILIDGGNSYYVDDIRRAKELVPENIHYGSGRFPIGCLSDTEEQHRYAR